MSALRLKRWMAYCVGWLILYVGGYAYARYCKWDEAANVLEALLPIFLAFPAAFLAAGFNRRNSYLQALRDLWQRLIPAVQTAIQYTHLTSPSQADFSRTQEALASAIDLLRGVFRNVPMSGSSTGLYPYENLKDIEKIISWLGYGENYRSNQAPLARKCMTRLWQEMHVAMLGEFDRDIPANPVSKYLNEGVSIGDLIMNDVLCSDDLALDSLASKPCRAKDRLQRAANTQVGDGGC